MNGLIRLLALIAVMLMPFGMTAPVQAHPVMGMTMSHCPAQTNDHHSKAPFGECTMACASALPAADRVYEEKRSIAHLAIRALPAQPLLGLHPDTATPPPKAS